ncbi:MAG: hypothetical protein JW908_12125 [Anaerolineales bacterium]|nr:hypothetical protein [Anaerolineales bacterium]
MFDFLFRVDAVKVDTVDLYGIFFGKGTACLNITSCMVDAVDPYGICFGMDTACLNITSFMGDAVDPYITYIGKNGVRPIMFTK